MGEMEIAFEPGTLSLSYNVSAVPNGAFQLNLSILALDQLGRVIYEKRYELSDRNQTAAGLINEEIAKLVVRANIVEGNGATCKVNLAYFKPNLLYLAINIILSLLSIAGAIATLYGLLQLILLKISPKQEDTTTSQLEGGVSYENGLVRLGYGFAWQR
ncbi:MAG: hypothetical protein QXS10_07160 [Candidatus Bathyarchaeia archaeon]